MLQYLSLIVDDTRGILLEDQKGKERAGARCDGGVLRLVGSIHCGASETTTRKKLVTHVIVGAERTTKNAAWLTTATT